LRLADPASRPLLALDRALALYRVPGSFSRFNDISA
jgi:hypothetical protein